MLQLPQEKRNLQPGTIIKNADQESRAHPFTRRRPRKRVGRRQPAPHEAHPPFYYRHSRHPHLWRAHLAKGRDDALV